MNHLAHLFLAGQSDASLLGNLSGDFVKGRLGNQFPADVERGILEHRRVDAFTDAHPVAGRFRRIIAAEHRHYARVISDIFLDHFLAAEWDKYSRESLSQFVERVFERLDRHIDAMPPSLQVVYPRMRDGNWLLSYASIDGIRNTLRHVSRRFSRAPRLEQATHLLTDRREELLDLFHRFMPDVIEHAKRLRSQP